MPAIGMRDPNRSVAVSAATPLDATTFGSMARGIASSSSSSSSHSPRWMSNNRVREALLASVTCALPPESFQTSQLSMVPKARCPASACARAWGTLSRIQASLVAEK